MAAWPRCTASVERLLSPCAPPMPTSDPTGRQADGMGAESSFPGGLPGQRGRRRCSLFLQISKNTE